MKILVKPKTFATLIAVKHGVERIKEVTGNGDLVESTLTRKLCHYVLRQVTGKSFTDVGKATGNGYHIARGDWLAISSYRNQEIWNWIQAVEEYAIGFTSRPCTVTELPNRTCPPDLPYVMTDWLPDNDELFNSEFGRVTNREWVIFEADRMQEATGLPHRACMSMGYVAIAQNNKADTQSQGAYSIDQ